MMRCPRCHRNLPEDMPYCIFCGTDCIGNEIFNTKEFFLRFGPLLAAIGILALGLYSLGREIYHLRKRLSF